MGDPIGVYEMDKYGVIVDTSPIGNPLGTLTKAQNAQPEPGGEAGTVIKRPGLKPFHATAGTGAVMGGIGVPARLGAAGLALMNPFTGITVSLLNFIRFLVEGPPRLGATFDDDARVKAYDPLDDFTEDAPVNDADPYALDDGSEAVFHGTLPLTYIGSGRSTIGRSVHDRLVATTYVNCSDGIRSGDVPAGFPALFPTKSIRQEDFGDVGDPFYNWAYASGTAQGQYFGGRSTAVLGNKLYYISDDYTPGTDFPTIRVFDGFSDNAVITAPSNPDVSASAPPTAIISLLAANGKLYFSTFDGGSSGAGGGTVKCSVYEYDPATGWLQRAGPTLTTGHFAYNLAWLYGRIWVGSVINDTADTTPAKLFWIRPHIDSAWTTDKTFAAGEQFMSGLQVLNGELWMSFLGIDATGRGGVSYTRDVTGTFSRINYAPPTVAPTASAVAGGALVDGHTYVFKYTYKDGTGHESAASDFVSQGVAGANLTVRVGVTASGEAGVNGINLYAKDTTAGETLFKLYASYTNTTTTHDVTSNTWSTGAECKEFETYTDLIVWPPESDPTTSPARQVYAIGATYNGKVSISRVNARGVSKTHWAIQQSVGNTLIGVFFGYSYAVNGSGSIVPTLWLCNSVANNGHIYNSTDGATWTQQTITVASGSTPTDEYVQGLVVQV